MLDEERSPLGSKRGATSGRSGAETQRALESSIKWARGRLQQAPEAPWSASDVRKLVDLYDAVTRQRAMTHLSWARDTLILLLGEGTDFKSERWDKACDIGREVLERVEDLLHVAGRDDIEPRLLERFKDAGFA